MHDGPGTTLRNGVIASRAQLEGAVGATIPPIAHAPRDGISIPVQVIIPEGVPISIVALPQRKLAHGKAMAVVAAAVDACGLVTRAAAISRVAHAYPQRAFANASTRTFRPDVATNNAW